MLQGRNAKRKLLSITNILVLRIIPSLVLKYCNIVWENYIGKMNIFVINVWLNTARVMQSIILFDASRMMELQILLIMRGRN